MKVLFRAMFFPLLAGCFACLPSAHAQQAEQPFVLPEGKGKETVQTLCIGCHDLRRIVNSNYSPEEWQNVVNMMTAAGAPMAQDQAAVVRDYLVAAFPQKQPRPTAAVIPGDAQVSFKEWTVPTPGS